MCSIDPSEDSADVWVQTFPIARLRHRCLCCGHGIEPGRKYLRLCTVSDGTAATAKVCLDCHEVMERFGNEHRFTPHPATLVDFLAECVREEGDGEQWLVDLALMRVRNREARAA